MLALNHESAQHAATGRRAGGQDTAPGSAWGAPLALRSHRDAGSWKAAGPGPAPGSGPSWPSALAGSPAAGARSHPPPPLQVNSENVVKVGHRQVVNMIRQGGNHLVLKVVTVTRSLDPDDTARKKGARGPFPRGGAFPRGGPSAQPPGSPSPSTPTGKPTRTGGEGRGPG